MVIIITFTIVFYLIAWVTMLNNLLNDEHKDWFTFKAWLYAHLFVALLILFLKWRGFL